MKLHQWHNHGAILSGVVSWGWRNREFFRNHPDTAFTNVDLNLFPGRQRGPLDDKAFFDLSIRRVPELIAFLKKTVHDTHLVNYCFDVLDIVERAAPSLLPRLKLVGWCHSDEDFYYYHLIKFRKYWSAIGCVSQRTFDVCRTLFPELAGRLFLIPYLNIPPPDSRPPRQPGSPLRIVYFGRLQQQQKRIFDFVPLIARLAGQPFHFTFIGEGSDKAELQRRLAPHAAQVTFREVIAPWQIPDELTRHDLFLLLSEYEGNSVALLEAMTAGLAPFLTQTRSGQEHLRSGDNCLLTPIGDTDALVNALRHHAAHPEQLAAMKLSARATADRLLTEFDYASKIRQVTDAVAAHPHPALTPLPPTNNAPTPTTFPAALQPV